MIKKRQQALLSSVDVNDDIVKWPLFWQELDIKIIPGELNVEVSSQQILENLPLIIREILNQHSDERLWTIVQRRFGLQGTTQLTLEELGIAFGVTRERVRQLEQIALKELREVLIEDEYTAKDYHVRSQVSRTMRLVCQIAVDEVEKAARENVLLQRIKERFDIDPAPVKPSLFLILELSGIERITFDKEALEPIWGIIESSQERKIKKGIEKLDTLPTEEFATPLSEIDILIHLNKGVRKSKRFSLEELGLLIELCSSVKEYSEGFYWGRFEHLVGRFNQVERILTERGEPVHIDEITREINHRLVKHGKRTVEPNNLANQISRDNRFVPIGRSGEWGLSSWSLNIETIVDLMKQCLIARNESATVEEVYAYVSERRPVHRSSVQVYLASINDFAKVDRTRWGLASWSEVEGAKTWNPKQVASFVERIFKRNRAKKIEYSIIQQALMDEAGVSTRQAQGMLNVNPVIETERDRETGELYAVYQPNYERVLDEIGTRFKRKKKTLRKKTSEAVRETLENAPGQQMALSELIDRLSEEYVRPRATFYSYISDLDFVEKFEVPDTGKKMCRLKLDEQEETPFDQVESIASSELRDNVARALSFLNIGDVDIALFLLSKEFEATLKKYLKLAHARGELHYLPQGRLNLNRMIDFVQKEDIITDKAVLHFLRQKRNDRAHGPTPSLEERRVMMRHAETTAGMYIDYIKFFDDLSHELV